MEKMYCYVGDVLGFSDMVSDLTSEEKENLSPEEAARFTPEERRKRVDSWIGLVKEKIAKYEIQRHQFISDTIFAGVEYTTDGLNRLLEFSRDMLNDGINISLPIRAGIAFGDVEWGSDISFGTALVNAHRLEEDQAWIGTCCEHDLPGLDDLWSFKKVFVYPAPMKSEKLLTHRPVISWDVPSYEDLRTKTSLNAMRNKYVDWKYSMIIQNTILYSIYNKAVDYEVIPAKKPDKFPGELMYILEFCIDDVFHDRYLERHGYKKSFSRE